MKKKTAIIIAAIVIVLAAAGVAVAVAVNNQSDDKSTSNNNSTNNESSKVDTSKTFNPKNLAELAYVANSTTTVGDQTVTSTIESDGKGTTKTTTASAGMTTESYVSGNDVITCMDGNCTKTTIDPTAVADVNADITKYRESAKNGGSETIDGKTYQKWTITTEETGDITYYIDESNRVGRIVMTSSTIVYDYKDVTITVPQV